MPAFRVLHLVAFCIVAIHVGAAGPAKAAQSTYSDAQLQLLFSGSRVEANGSSHQICGTEAGDIELKLRFSVDGKLEIQYHCNASGFAAAREQLGKSFGKWWIEENKICVKVLSKELQEIVWVRGNCWNIGKGQFNFAAYDDDNKAIFRNLIVYHPKYSSKNALLAALKTVKDRLAAQIAAPVPTLDTAQNFPPAEYKGLPKGTVVRFRSDRGSSAFTVTKNEGFEYTYKIGNSWFYRYAKFGKQGRNQYSHGGSERNEVETRLDQTSKTALVGLWPLKVGNKSRIRFQVLVDTMGRYQSWDTTVVQWEIKFQVIRTEPIELNGKTYASYVIREHAEGLSKNRGYVPNVAYTATIWYNPNSGLILKSETEDTRRPTSYNLVSVKYPKGTTTHALTPIEGTAVPVATVVPKGPIKAAPAQPPAQPPAETASIEDRLTKLKSLFDKGLIDDNHYKRKKAVLLEQL